MKFKAVGQIKKSELGRACRTYGRKERRIQGMVGKPEGKRPLGRPRRTWEVNINPLKAKSRLLYLKTQSVPRSKHLSSRLEN